MRHLRSGLLCGALLLSALGCATPGGPPPQPTHVSPIEQVPAARRFYGVDVTEWGLFIQLERLVDDPAGPWTRIDLDT